MDYYMAPDVTVYLRIEGRSSLLLDQVCGIGYQDQDAKIPVYGYSDVEFAAMAQGRAIVSGLLIVNKGFKNSIGTILAKWLSNDEIKKGNAEKITPEELSQKQAELTSLADAIKNLTTDLDLIRDLTVRRYKNDGEFTYYDDWDVDGVVQAMSRIDDLLSTKPLLQYQAGAICHYDQFARDMDPVIQDLESSNTSKETYRNTTNPPPDSAKFNNRLDESALLVAENAINKFSDGTALFRNSYTVSHDILGRQEPTNSNSETEIVSLIGHKLFKALQDSRKSVQLIVKFHARSGSNYVHEITLNDCFFSNDSTNVSVDNRDNIKEAYQFIAKNIT